MDLQPLEFGQYSNMKIQKLKFVSNTAPDNHEGFKFSCATPNWGIFLFKLYLPPELYNVESFHFVLKLRVSFVFKMKIGVSNLKIGYIASILYNRNKVLLGGGSPCQSGLS